MRAAERAYREAAWAIVRDAEARRRFPRVAAWARAAVGLEDGPGRCRTCGALIRWRAGVPVDPDGSSHFASCPDAASWRRS